MKYCKNCGKQIEDDAKFCPYCGSSTSNDKNDEYTTDEGFVDQTMYQKKIHVKKGNETIRLIAFIFMILSCVSYGVFLIPLIWLVPMTIKVYNAYKDTTYELSVGFKVCTLLFCNFVSGILLLCDNN